MYRRFRTVLTGVLLLTAFALFIPHTQADLVDDLKAKIEERNKVIADLEKEISQYQAEVEKTGTEAKSLKNAISKLELTRKKLSAEIKVLQNKISSATLTIDKLGLEISDSQKNIDRKLHAMRETFRLSDMEESNSFVETIFNYPRLSTFLDKTQNLAEVNRSLKEALTNVRALKKDLEEKKAEAQGKRQELISLSGDLTDKKKVAEYNAIQTSKLLSDTKNKQSTYQKILNEKLTLKESFEKELIEYESKLKFAIDPTSIPEKAPGVLAWPTASRVVTQVFGDTDFARAHAQAYNGRGHNGIDLKAPIGTPIKAALSGKVVATGDTDKACPGASYGRWVFIEHPNGLSTLYAHFSVIKVVKDQVVQTGEVIGLSGDTGYATGPHLHFSVYASQGVRILSRQSKVCKTTYTMPIGSLDAYLNPLLYL